MHEGTNCVVCGEHIAWDMTCQARLNPETEEFEAAHLFCDPTKEDGVDYQTIPIDQIKPAAYNPRKDLQPGVIRGST